MFEILQLKKKYHRTKILIVDDEPNIVHTLQDRLEMNGYEVFTADNGRTGLDAALRNKPDIILLDIIMPIMDGLQMLKALRQTPGGNDISVIMVTAKSDPSDKIVAQAGNIDDYIVKPFDLSSLIGKIEQLVEHRKATAK